MQHDKIDGSIHRNADGLDRAELDVIRHRVYWPLVRFDDVNLDIGRVRKDSPV